MPRLFLTWLGGLRLARRRRGSSRVAHGGRWKSEHGGGRNHVGIRIADVAGLHNLGWIFPQRGIHRSDGNRRGQYLHRIRGTAREIIRIHNRRRGWWAQAWWRWRGGMTVFWAPIVRRVPLGRQLSRCARGGIRWNGRRDLRLSTCICARRVRRAGARRVAGVGAVSSSDGRRGVRGVADMVGPSGGRSEVD